MSQLFVLFEHAMGCALFRAVEYEEGDEFIAKIQRSASDFNTFSENVEFVAIQPFVSGREALEYMNNSSEGVLIESIQQFLENNVPKSKKKRPVILGVLEAKLATVISEVLGIECSINKEVLEVTRGIRLHFHKLVKGIKDFSTTCKSQLALGHHYARAKVKFNVNRIDNMVIQSINLIDQLDKDINTFAMRVREWYSFHFPELVRIVPENHLYVKCVGVIKNRKEMPEDIHEQLENILMDSEKAQNVLEVAHSSMGMEISPLDLENITIFATRVSSLMTRRKELVEYLRNKMHNVAPNLAALIGDMVGARLIAHAGSLINLAKFPASTVQILGAEKALFRAIKTRGNTPKYGLIYHSSFIGRAGKTNKGRISRFLANKCSVATRIDCFRDIPTEVFGNRLKQQVEDRLKFYDTGDIPAKNADVMVDALSEADVVAADIAKQKRKAEKKEKKRRSQLLAEISQTAIGDISFTDTVSLTETNNDKPLSVKSEKVEKCKRESADVADDIAKQKRKAEKKEKKRRSQLLADISQTSIGDNSFIETVSLTETNNDEPLSVKSEQKENCKMESADVVAADIAKQKRKAEKKEKKRRSQLLSEISQTSIGDISFTDTVSLTETNNGEPLSVKSGKKKKRKRERMEDSKGVESFKKSKLSEDMETEDITAIFEGQAE